MSPNRRQRVRPDATWNREVSLGAISHPEAISRAPRSKPSFRRPTVNEFYLAGRVIEP